MKDQHIGTTVAHSPGMPPAGVFAVQAFCLLFALVALAPGFAALVPMVAAFGVCAAIAGYGISKSYPHGSLGLCNTVTLIRAAMVAFLFGCLFQLQAISPWLVFWVGALALSLDGLDGWLARRSGLQSGFGARFDMETDAAIGAVLAIWVMASGITGPQVLILGFARYAFVVAGWALPQLRAELPASFRRKTVCVVQIGALLALVCPIMPAGLVLPLLISATAALCYSFAIDIIWLMRRPQ